MAATATKIGENAFRMRVVAFRLSEDEHAKLSMLATLMCVTLSDVMRMAIVSHIGLSELWYGDVRVCVEDAPEPVNGVLWDAKWRVERGDKVLFRGLSCQDAIARAQAAAKEPA